MANDIAGRPWVLDTATPGVPIWRSWMTIDHFEYVGYAAQGNICLIRDQNGRVVWEGLGASDLSEVRSGKVEHVNGLIPDTIEGGGICIVYVR